MSVTTREQEIIDAETGFWSAIRDGDAEAASSMITEQCLITGGQGHSVMPRSRFSATVAST